MMFLMEEKLDYFNLTCHLKMQSLEWDTQKTMQDHATAKKVQQQSV